MEETECSYFTQKIDKQLLKNYRQISLLSIFGKIFETIIYNNIFEYLTANKLISENQSGFKPSDSRSIFFSWYTSMIYHQWSQEVTFSRKVTKTNYPALIFNENPVHQVALQKHLGMLLDCKLNFEEHLKIIFNKVNKTIALLCKFQNFWPRKSLLTINKSFISSHFDYGDIIYDQSYNASFHQRLESFPCNAALTATGAIRGTSEGELYHELGSESLQIRRWYRKLSFLYKVIANESPSYLLIPRNNTTRSTRGSNNFVRH